MNGSKMKSPHTITRNKEIGMLLNEKKESCGEGVVAFVEILVDVSTSSL